MNKTETMIVGAAIFVVSLLSINIGVGIGEREARQRYAPMACEARCEVTMQEGKVIKTVCPDSTGAMP